MKIKLNNNNNKSQEQKENELEKLIHDHIGCIRFVGIRNFVIVLAILWYVMFQSHYSSQ